MAICAALAPGSIAVRELYPWGLESIYELSYLKVFVRWEDYLEASFLRYMCGYQSRHGQATLVGGVPYYVTLAAAQTALLGNQHYVLWHGTQAVLTRVRRHVLNGPHESVIAAAQSRLFLTHAAIRHRIAHGQEDARNKFYLATMSLAGRRYPGARAGRFLRHWDFNVSPPMRWLESITLTRRLWQAQSCRSQESLGIQPVPRVDIKTFDYYRTGNELSRESRSPDSHRRVKIRTSKVRRSEEPAPGTC